jgi:glycosyltransferase involved in cell wall biosynthesis
MLLPRLISNHRLSPPTKDDLSAGLMPCNDAVPSVAVVIPCWNAERWIGRGIQSVLDERDQNIKIIVIDDGSTDASLDVIKSFGDTICWTTAPNSGACLARNQGLAMARAEYILFLDADDFLEAGSLKEWARCAIDSDADIVFGPFAYERDKRKVPGRLLSPPVTSQSVLCQWLEGSFTPPCAVLWRRSFVTAIGGWNVMARRNQDGELVMRALLHSPRIAVADAGLGIYVQHDSPDRISKRVSHSIIASELTSLANLWEIAQARGHQDLQLSFAHAFYRIAYMAYANEIGDIGHEALATARKLGLRRHIGSPIHRGLSTVLGLKVKLLLSGLLKGRIALNGRSWRRNRRKAAC